MQLVTEKTSLAELELKLHAFGLTLTCTLGNDARFTSTMFDRDGISGIDSGATFAESVNNAMNRYMLAKGQELAILPTIERRKVSR